MTNQHDKEKWCFSLLPVTADKMDEMWRTEFYGIPTYICLDDRRVWPHPKQLQTTRHEAALLEAKVAIEGCVQFNSPEAYAASTRFFTTINEILGEK